MKRIPIWAVKDDPVTVEPKQAVEQDRGWGGYADDAWKRDSKAVVACDGKGNGAVLWTVGPHVAFEIEEGGLRDLGDLGLDYASAGISIWVGRYVAAPRGYFSAGDEGTEPKGAFRAPTDEEWLAIREGRCPWPDDRGVTRFRSEHRQRRKPR